INLENMMQEFILLINPFVSAFLLTALCVWLSKPSRQMAFLRYCILIGTLILYANLVFYRNFTDFIKIPQLFQWNNVVDLGSSILTLITAYDILLFADVFVVEHLIRKLHAIRATHYSQ